MTSEMMAIRKMITGTVILSQNILFQKLELINVLLIIQYNS